MHAWNAIAPDLERPDRVIFDLDPDPALLWNTHARCAIAAQDRTQRIGSSVISQDQRRQRRGCRRSTCAQAQLERGEGILPGGRSANDERAALRSPLPLAPMHEQVYTRNIVSNRCVRMPSSPQHLRNVRHSGALRRQAEFMRRTARHTSSRTVQLWRLVKGTRASNFSGLVFIVPRVDS